MQSKKWKKEPESGKIQKALLSMFHGSRKRQLFILGIDIPSRCFRIISYYMVFFLSWAKKVSFAWMTEMHLHYSSVSFSEYSNNWKLGQLDLQFQLGLVHYFFIRVFFLLDEIEAKFLIAIVC